MPKAGKRDGDVRELSEQDLRFAVRGRHVERYQGLPAPPSTTVHVWAPLRNLEWEGLERQLGADTWVRSGPSYRGYEHAQFAEFLSGEELNECRQTEHWLSIVQPAQSGISPRAMLNLFLLGLWFVKATRCQIPLRFEEADSGVRTVARILDRFRWVGEHLADDVRDKDLDDTGLLLAPLRALYGHSTRLNIALGLTYRACVVGEWHAAFVCFAAAAEALLTCSQGSEGARQFAPRYAALVSRLGADRVAEESRFAVLYSVRSQIMHDQVATADERRLHDLADLADALRRIWRVVLEIDEVRSALQGDDNQRRRFFARA